MAFGGSTEPYFDFESVNLAADKCGCFLKALALNSRVIDTLADVLCSAGFSIQKTGYTHVCSVELIIEYN
jgi:hypothetical protein